MSRRRNDWVDIAVWDTVNTQRDDVQRLQNEVFEQRRALNQERSEREREIAELKARLTEAEEVIRSFTRLLLDATLEVNQRKSQQDE